jgi:hypothetical protein
MDTPNIVYYMFLSLNNQYEHSTTLIFHKKNHPDALKTVVQTGDLHFMLFWPHNSA